MIHLRFPSLLAAALVCAIGLGPGCGGAGGGGSTPPPVTAADPEILPGGTDPEPTFAGCREAIPLADGVFLAWEPVTGEVVQNGLKVRVPRTGIDYRVYLSSLPLAFAEESPDLTVRDATRATLGGLVPGRTYWVTVRAWEGTSALEGNRLALSFVPAPVRYLRPGSDAGLRDGLGPATAFASLAEALPNLPVPATLFLAGGDLPGGVVLPGGISLVGGFDAGFDLQARDPARHATRLLGGAGPVLLLLGPGHSLVSGLLLDGRERSLAGVEAREVPLALRNSTLVRMLGDGVRLRGDAYTERRVEGDLSFLRLLGNRGAGLVAEGLTGLRIQRCLGRRNGAEGVRALGLQVNPEGDLRLRLDGCRLEGNGSVGVEIGLVSGPAVPAGGVPGAALVEVAGCRIRENTEEGFRSTIDLLPGAGVAGRLVATGCEIVANGGNGILAGAAEGCHLLVHGCRISANRGPAGVTVGTSGGWVRVCNNAVFANGGAGIRVLAGQEGRRVEVHNNDVAANGATGLEVAAGDAALLSNTAVWNRIDVEAPWVGATLRLSGTGGPGVFTGNPGYSNFPAGVQFTNAPGTAGMVHVPWSGVTAPGEFVEIGDDGVGRPVQEIVATAILFSPPLAAPPPVGSAVFVVLSPEAVAEDLSLTPSSAAAGKGSILLPDRGQAAATCGFTGGPLAVPQVGLAAAGSLPDLPFQDALILPPPGTPAGQVDRFTVILDRPLEAASVTTETVQVLRAADLMPLNIRINVFGQGGDRFVVFGFPVGKDPLLLVVTTGVKAAGGMPLSLPVLAFYPP